MKYVFTNSESVVVNIVHGPLSQKQTSRLLTDYSVLFGATAIVAVDAETSVWIGGSYTDGVFAPPPEPEPAPEPLPEPLPEVITEPEI